MSKQATRNNDQKTTAFYAIATFVTLSVVALLVWALTRPADSVAAASSMPAASAAAAVPAEHEHIHDFERISIDDFKAGMDKGEFVVIDVRSMEQYVASHIPGSLHIPVTRIEGEIPYLPKGKTIVTYCTCPAEESSGEAAMILARGGVKAVALLGGLEAWTKPGYPIETGVQ